jgi:hypothetical protein
VDKSLYRRAVGYGYDAVKIMGYEGEYNSATRGASGGIIPL